jgi:predicted phosphoribosyltransferase
MFRDRIDAGCQLAQALERHRSQRPLVLALPRGGVVVGAEVARRLGGDLDVLLIKKLRAPGNPELALGAVTEDGHSYLNEEIMRAVKPDSEYVDAEIKARVGEIEVQRRRYRKARGAISPKDRIVLLVDDGLATGATMIAATQVVGAAHPRKVIVAVPVAPPDTLMFIQRLPHVDGAECLLSPAWFGGVGQYYQDFTQVAEEEVIDILRQFPVDTP